MPPLTKANCAAFKKVVPTRGIVAKKPAHPMHSPGNPSLALKALLETQARARAAMAERHSQERTEFENACQRERSKLEARADQSAAGGPQQEQRAQQQCVYCKQAFPPAAWGAAVELCACAGGCKAIKCDSCEWTSQCDDKEGFCPTCCLARIGGPMFLPADTWQIYILHAGDRMGCEMKLVLSRR